MLVTARGPLAILGNACHENTSFSIDLGTSVTSKTDLHPDTPAPTPLYLLRGPSHKLSGTSSQVLTA